MSLFIAVESSCDETSIAFLEGDENASNVDLFDYLNNFKIIGSVVSSQIKIHEQYGGVVPEIGARKHADQIHWIFENLVKDTFAGKTIQEILCEVKAIFVTTEPGLISALRVGVEFAKTLSFYTKLQSGALLPIYNINHLHGHMASCFWQPNNKEKFAYSRVEIMPHLHLLVSGGNSQIIHMESWKKWQIIGKTLDDAGGESLDKIGRMLGLPYPGGVYVSRIAGLEEANPVDLPFGMKHTDSFDFSFSGLKTAVRYKVQKSNVIEFEKPLTGEEIELLLSGGNLDTRLQLIKDICISAQYVVITQLISKFEKGIKHFAPLSIGLSGGVSANRLLRSKLAELAKKYDVELFIPEINLTGDNAMMIGLAGLLNLKDNS